MDINNRNWIVSRSDLLHGKLLEVGSYVVSGQESIALRPAIESFVDQYIGIDMRSGPGVDIVTSEDNAFPFQDNSFDVVVSLDTLEHVKDPFSFVENCARVLKPGGHFFLATVFSFPIHGYPDDYWRFTPSCLKMLVEKYGLEVVGDLTPSECSAKNPNAAHHLANPSIVKILAKKQ